MKYIVIELQTQADGTVTNLVSPYDTLNEAESKFHQILMYAATSSLAVHAAVILTSEGYMMKNECYKHIVTTE